MKQFNKQSIAGNFGGRIRSDCRVTLELTESGGREITIKSKVKAMFGKSILKNITDILDFYQLENVKLLLEDSGALPFVILARVEVAIKQLTGTEKEFLPDMNEACLYPSEKERFRFSRLYLPGNTPSMMINAGIHQANGIILDLEDSVAPAKKEEARHLIRNALRCVNFYGVERMVRINQGQRGIDDLKFVVPHNVHLLLVPKCESAEYIKKLEAEIARLSDLHKITNPIFLMPIIESALGVEKAFEIATASENVVSLAIGLEDFTADLGVRRTNEGTESFYARTRIVNACKAAGIQPIDSVFSDVEDMEALKANVKASKSLGFEGMGCIHPRQIRVIHESFAPESVEIDKAKKIYQAFVEAEKQGLGVVSLGSKMIDPPVVKRAQTTINLAIQLGLLSADWNKETHETKNA
ncbi:MAG: citrate lyase ACP [Bacteroidia bacterium]|nr:MAG: citrate lyase ACP [Bacteroidia bacterium]PIE85878.1 MAG: citrate lyase ACP [Bacteroidia bacterium]